MGKEGALLISSYPYNLWIHSYHGVWTAARISSFQIVKQGLQVFKGNLIVQVPSIFFQSHKNRHFLHRWSSFAIELICLYQYIVLLILLLLQEEYIIVATKRWVQSRYLANGPFLSRIHLPYLWIRKYLADDTSVNFYDKVFLHFLPYFCNISVHSTMKNHQIWQKFAKK